MQAQPLGAAPAVAVLEQQLLGRARGLRVSAALSRCATAVRSSRSRAGMRSREPVELGRDRRASISSATRGAAVRRVSMAQSDSGAPGACHGAGCGARRGRRQSVPASRVPSMEEYSSEWLR